MEQVHVFGRFDGRKARPLTVDVDADVGAALVVHLFWLKVQGQVCEFGERRHCRAAALELRRGVVIARVLGHPTFQFLKEPCSQAPAAARAGGGGKDIVQDFTLAKPPAL